MSVRTFFDPHRVEQLRKQGISPQRQLTSGTAPEARTSLELVEENARLRAEVRRLSDEVARLTAAARGPSPPSPRREERELDDAARRFALLELDL